MCSSLAQIQLTLKLFGNQLIVSIEKIGFYSCLHVHVINPDEEDLKLVEKYLNIFEKFTASYEELDVEEVMVLSKAASPDWLKTLPKKILVVIEQVRDHLSFGGGLKEPP